MKAIKAIASFTLATGLMVSAAQAVNPVPPITFSTDGTQVGWTHSGDIATSQTWTADKVHNLVGEIKVLPGASLTIEPGTIIATETGGTQGSIAVCRGAQIYVMGEENNPVIFTSWRDVWGDSVAHKDPVTGVAGAAYTGWTADLSQPTQRNRATGKFRPVCKEWGSLAIMGNGIISSSHYGKTPVGTPPIRYKADGVTPNPMSPDLGVTEAKMEGLTVVLGQESLYFYGGNNDEDDSGIVKYVSLRYGGKVVTLADELNGLSLGGVGRGTDIHHIDIFNNVDDGIEIWGGAVNLKYVNIWNIGDDSFDLDEGWRGKAQFGLIVQGYSDEADQGSGMGDNVFEHDGAERSDAQPVTTAAIYNFTAIGMPNPAGMNGGDEGTAWRDGCRIQYRNCMWIDLGSKLVKKDNVDGDGGCGYGGVDSIGTLGTPTFSTNTLSWAGVWTTAWTHSHLTGVEAYTVATPTTLYKAQSAGTGTGQGQLSEITNSVFYNIPTGLGDAPVDLSQAGGLYGNAQPGSLPIAHLVRGATIDWFASSKHYGVNMVTELDPRPIDVAGNDALTLPCTTATEDGFFTAAPFRGAFSATNNWCKGWTAADAFGLFTNTAGSNPATPATALKLIGTVTSFQTVTGVTYTVEQSEDGVAWTPVKTFTEDVGTTVTILDLGLDTSKLYRVIVQ